MIILVEVEWPAGPEFREGILIQQQKIWSWATVILEKLAEIF